MLYLPRGLVFTAALAIATPGHVYSQSDGEAASAISRLAGDASAGERLYRRNCRACHGATAKGASSYPALVGQEPAYLIDKIVRYRAGEIFGPNTPLMAQRVKDLSNQDIASVVAYVVSLEDN